MLSVIITLSAQDFPPAKRFMKLVSWKLDTSECFLIGLAGSCVRMKRKGKVQSGTRVTGREWLLVPHSDPESWLTQPANEYGVASPREYQRGENVLARGLKCLVPSL